MIKKMTEGPRESEDKGKDMFSVEEMQQFDREEEEYCKLLGRKLLVQIEARAKGEVCMSFVSTCICWCVQCTCHVCMYIYIYIHTYIHIHNHECSRVFCIQTKKAWLLDCRSEEMRDVLKHLSARARLAKYVYLHCIYT
jgi:hypothetical protein